MKSQKSPLVHAVTLGCPKNRVDTEVMLGDLLGHGYALAACPEDADVVFVNTCGFLAEARRESLGVLRDVARRMRPGARLVAAGCMTERFRDAIESEVPEVDLVAGVRDLLRLRGLLDGEDRRVPAWPTSEHPRLLTTPARSAYLKVADGCSRRCTFCIIPRLRGRQRSRVPDDVVAEARALAASGVREAVLVAQDLTHYGQDLPGRPDLASLVDRIALEAPDLHWIRLMYLYPRDLSDRLLDVIATRPNVLPYLDLPVQHADDGVLRAMRRGTSRRGLERLVGRVRARLPRAVLRTTYLVGFPGETDESFETLLSFARRMRFEMAGVFRFSPEPGARAAALPDPVPLSLARRRERRLRQVLDEVAGEQRAGLIGQVHEALVTQRGPGRTATGRLWFQAPEVDGGVRIQGCDSEPGAFVQVRIIGLAGSDFEADVVVEGRELDGGKGLTRAGARVPRGTGKAPSRAFQRDDGAVK